jgi:hypothetical protein
MTEIPQKKAQIIELLYLLSYESIPLSFRQSELLLPLPDTLTK